MGLTKQQRAQRAAVTAGTHEWADDGFGNRYLKELPPKPPEFQCIHCGGKVVAIAGKQITPGEMKPYKHAPGAGMGCPKNWGPLDAEDVREL